MHEAEITDDSDISACGLMVQAKPIGVRFFTGNQPAPGFEFVNTKKNDVKFFMNAQTGKTLHQSMERRQTRFETLDSSNLSEDMTPRFFNAHPKNSKPNPIASRTLGCVYVAAAVALLLVSCQTQKDELNRKENTMNQTAIRQRIEDYAKAIRSRDIDGVMSLYAPDIVSFDLDPPLRYAGAVNKRQAWQKFFAARTGTIGYLVSELDVTAQGDLAFVRSLNHVSGTLADGHAADLWVRWTACLHRIDGVWLVVHDHVSVPADLKHGQAVLNLTP